MMGNQIKPESKEPVAEPIQVLNQFKYCRYLHGHFFGQFICS